jgi:hypothetical protein
LGIKALYEHQKKIQALAEENKIHHQEVVEEIKLKNTNERLVDWKKCLAHIKRFKDEYDELTRQLESKE